MESTEAYTTAPTGGEQYCHYKVHIEIQVSPPEDERHLQNHTKESYLRVIPILQLPAR